MYSWTDNFAQIDSIHFSHISDSKWSSSLLGWVAAFGHNYCRQHNRKKVRCHPRRLISCYWPASCESDSTNGCPRRDFSANQIGKGSKVRTAPLRSLTRSQRSFSRSHKRHSRGTREYHSRCHFCITIIWFPFPSQWSRIIFQLTETNSRSALLDGYGKLKDDSARVL